MRRRKYLTVWGGLLVSLAGCAEGSDSGDAEAASGEDDATETEADTVEPTETEEPREPSFELASADAPDEVEINQDWTWSMTIRNSGDAEGTFSTTIYVTDLEANNRATVSDIEETIGPGESYTYESSLDSYPYITRLRFELEDGTELFEVQVLSRWLSFTELYESPNQVLATVTDVEFQDSYTWEGSSGRAYEEEPDAGNRWAFVYVYAENNSESTELLPTKGDFTVWVDDRQYDHSLIGTDEGQYEGGEVGPDVDRDGWICYEVPEDVATSDLSIEWFGSTVSGDYGVRWSVS